MTEQADKDDKVEILCTEEQAVRWREFAAGYTNYAQAMEDALNTFDNYPRLFERRRPGN